MAKKSLTVKDITGNLLTTNLYIENGTLIVVYNNTERKIYTDIAFFEIVTDGETLLLNFSINGTDHNYNESIDLSTVHNINGVLVRPV
ncbi:hypothetical protein ACWOAH_05635 [Vagococcus vulneris]|uniref:Uncharacterized protein n=1 Tax=Vagococcus vulneris TaxID=1977869 RepID=A0A429ZZD2_9ENTE|nr:hypothetical protein [Vagococcus vulneris]RST99353.1 hypothetical protein CBF37_05120 [Vagococcus vulneris]